MKSLVQFLLTRLWRAVGRRGMAGVLGLGSLVTVPTAAAAEVQLLNVSFDVSRELFARLNPAFVAARQAATGDSITIRQSHAGSTKQARAVVDGLEADVVTLNQVTDVDMLARRGKLLADDWRSRLPQHSSPYTSTIVFLVRAGNPRAILDWSDLVKPGVGVLVPNPKTSGNGRYSYLAAWAYAQRKLNFNEAEAREFVAKLFRNVPVFDTGGRGATTSFAERGLGDVLLTFEAEACLALQEFGSQRLQLVRPSFSIEAEMPVAVVDAVARRRGTEAVARAYLEFLYTEPAQELIAQAYFRPRSESVARKHASRFGTLEQVSVDEFFGGWDVAHRTHFAEGGTFDQITPGLR